MARNLYEAHTEYFSDSVSKASCKISSILYDARYIGENGYPVIVEQSLFEKVQSLKGKQFCPQKKTNHAVEPDIEEFPVMTTYIPTAAVFEREEELKEMLRDENANAEKIRQAILGLAAEKYNSII